MTTILTEQTRTGAYIEYEESPQLSREAITIAASGPLTVGTVLGRITTSGKYVALNTSASDGSQTAAAILWAAIDATGADVKAVANVRDTIARQYLLVFPAGISGPDLAQAIAALGAARIICR